jgi:hypothetical protein
MPMCEKGNLVRNYKNNTDYAISNHTTTSRTNAQRLSYGLQTSGFKRDTNGMILSKSSFLEGDGVGYGNTGWIPDNTIDFTLELIKSKDSAQFFDGIWNGAVAKHRFAIGTEVNGNIRVDIGSVNKYIATDGFTSKQYLVTVSYDKNTKQIKIYEDSILKHTYITDYESSGISLPLLKRSDANVFGNSSKRLLKVHQKVLTQDEIIQNFNTYQAQGLLNA